MERLFDYLATAAVTVADTSIGLMTAGVQNAWMHDLIESAKTIAALVPHL